MPSPNQGPLTRPVVSSPNPWFSRSMLAWDSAPLFPREANSVSSTGQERAAPTSRPRLRLCSDRIKRLDGQAVDVAHDRFEELIAGIGEPAL